MSMLSGMSDAERSQMREFRSQMVDAVTSGNFNAEEFSKQAPEAMKTFTEQSGIDLTSMLEQMSARVQQKGGMAENMQPASGISPFSGQNDQGLSTLLEALLDDDSSRIEPS